MRNVLTVKVLRPSVQTQVVQGCNWERPDEDCNEADLQRENSEKIIWIAKHLPNHTRSSYVLEKITLSQSERNSTLLHICGIIIDLKPQLKLRAWECDFTNTVLRKNFTINSNAHFFIKIKRLFKIILRL